MLIRGSGEMFLGGSQYCGASQSRISGLCFVGGTLFHWAIAIIL
jgi:hypothetical protein